MSNAGLARVFSVGVRDKPKVFFGVPFRYARSAFIVEAETDRKAKNAVARYLKLIGKDDVVDIVDAIPAEHLPAIAQKTGANKK
jgi:hypothetical protein